MESCTSNFISGISFITSIVSLFISYFTFKRDQGLLAFSVKKGVMISNFQGNKTRQEGIFFRIVNVGRRPVTLTGIFGTTDHFLRRFLARFLPLKLNWVTFPSQLHNGFVADDNGSFRTLSEGQIVDQAIFQPDSDNLIKAFAEIKRCWVTDSKGKAHHVSQGQLRQIKKDIKKKSG